MDSAESDIGSVNWQWLVLSKVRVITVSVRIKVCHKSGFYRYSHWSSTGVMTWQRGGAAEVEMDDVETMSNAPYQWALSVREW